MKVIRSFGYAAKGIKNCYSTERNFKVQLYLSILALILGFVFSISFMQWLAILLCIAFVLSMEMINTVIEKICNFISPGFHPLIKIIKDIAAGAVLLASTASFISGCIIFLPKIFHYLKTI